MAEGTVQNIEIKLDDGSIVKGSTPDEIITTLAKMKVDTASALREKNTQLEAQTAELARLRAADTQRQTELQQAQAKQAEEERQKRIKEGNGFDRDNYYNLLNTDPFAAANYLDSFRFGIPDPKEVPNTFIQMNQKISNFEQQSVAGAFLYEHFDDYDNKPENNAALNKRLSELTSRGYPFEITTMNMAYDQLVREGAIKRLEPAAPEAPPAPAPNPSLSGTGGGAPAPEPDFSKMSTEKLKEYMQSQGMSV